VLAEIIMYFLSFFMAVYYFSNMVSFEFFSSSFFADKVTFLLIGLAFMIGGFMLSSSYGRVKFSFKLP
jgi:hypothetical protein